MLLLIGHAEQFKRGFLQVLKAVFMIAQLQYKRIVVKVLLPGCKLLVVQSQIGWQPIETTETYFWFSYLSSKNINYELFAIAAIFPARN
jgi:hypothetical protein